MSFVRTLGLSVAVAVLACTVSIAQETEKKSCCSSGDKGACCSKSKADGTVSAGVEEDKQCCSKCTMTAAMKKLPKMTYKVGDESVCCSDAADALAKKHEKPIQFVVGEKTYDDHMQAYTALVESTESFVNKFVTPTKCEKSGKTSIAGASCGCPMEAGKKTELVKKAIDEVKMSYVVGDKECHCPMEAKNLAADSPNKTKYVVDGKETCCNLEARLNLAKAKYAAAIEALASTEKKEAETASASS